jgi:DNA-binding transcriptional ArsR family regulator
MNTPPTHSLTPELLELLADRVKALAEPARLSLLTLLRAEEMSVGDLVGATRYEPPRDCRRLPTV